MLVQNSHLRTSKMMICAIIRTGVAGPVRHFGGTRRDGKPKKPLAVCRNKCCKPHNGTSHDFYAYPTNDDADLSSIAVKGDKDNV
jgi:hypothetical protein